jgi:hypothetical protein
MKAVWSFWTKPFEAHHHSVWPSAKHHLLAWVLSVETAKQHYPDTWLITDGAGARMLVDGIGLQFTRVSTELNALAQHDPDWWTLGKVYAYHLQTEPFVHIDSDIFLWKRLPAGLERADVFAQNPNPLSASTPYYQPEQLEHAIAHTTGGWLPDEWLWYRRMIKNQRAESCGLVGGARTDFIRRYAEASLRLINDPRNQQTLQSLPNKRMHALLIEEFLLAACVEYYKASAVLRSGSVRIKYLFNSMSAPGNPDYLAQAGYTHLMSMKRNLLYTERLENRVRSDYPKHYRRCLKYLDCADVGTHVVNERVGTS